MSSMRTDEAAARVHRRHKTTNRLQSLLLLVAMALLLSLCGWLVAGPEGIGWAVVVGVLSLIFSPRLSPRLVLRLFGARRLSRAEAPRLFEVVEALARRAELPVVPQLHYIASPMLNAFTVGSREEPAVAITDGLMRDLTLRELAGVLAHEISHIRNNDLWVMGLADLLASLTRFMALFGTVLLFFNLPILVTQTGEVPWLLILILTAAPTAGLLLQLALSRTREFDADLDAAHLCGDPEGLASALVRIEQRQGRFWEGLMPGRRGRGGPSLLRTHPETQERVRRLLELSVPPPVLPRWEELPLHVPFAHANRRPRYRVGGYWY